jgi:hypothetical protein
VSDIRARQGVEHLQAAAVEVIAALRAFLDVAEEVVRDPSAAASMAASLVETVRPTGAEASTAEPRVTRIRVS